MSNEVLALAPKLCRCGEERPAGKSWCPKCTKEYHANYRAKRSHINRAYQKEYYRNHSKTHIEKTRANKLKRDFGITQEQYESMAKSQSGVCAICGDVNRAARRLSVDHNHNTGKVRGLLCSKCNAAIGLFKEDTATIMSAIEYLEKHQNHG